MNQHRGCDSLFWLVKGNTNSPRPTVSRLVSENLHLQCVWRVSPWINHRVYPFQRVSSMRNTCRPPGRRDAFGNDRCRWKFKTGKSQKRTLASWRGKKQFGHSGDFELGLHANMGKLDLVYNRISLLCSRLKWLNRRILIQLMPRYSSDPVRWNSWDKWTNIEAQAINQSTRSFAHLYRHITKHIPFLWAAPPSGQVIKNTLLRWHEGTICCTPTVSTYIVLS